MARMYMSQRILFLVLFFIAPARAAVSGMQDLEPVNYSTKDAAGRGPHEANDKFYIGNYGETFSFGDEWTLHKPFLQHGMEVVRFHSNIQADRNAPAPVIKESDYEKVENYWSLRLTQLLIIPENDQAFSFAGLLAAKENELRSQGASFEIKGAPAPDYYWPKNTFQVYITAPYRLHQLYVESEGKLFILTGGLDEKGGTEHFFRVFFEEEFIGSLGSYFEHLHPEATDSASPETLNMTFAKRLCFPLFGAGMLLFGWPWAKRYTRPLALGATAAALLGLASLPAGFYLARLLVSRRLGSLVSPGVIGWTWIPVLIGVTFFRSMRVGPMRRWIARAVSIVAALSLAGFAVETRHEIASGQFPVATDFALYMCCVGILYGICLGLSAKNEGKSGNQVLVALTFFLLIGRPVSVAAQTPQEELQAKIIVNQKSNGGRAYTRIATKEYLEKDEDYQFQRVEITGIVATDDGNDYGPRKMFDISLHPSHNDDGSPVLPKGSSWIAEQWYSLRHISSDRHDINDLFEDKTGKLTDRGREILAPLARKDVHVNEIVAHSWGAVLLNNAIREGLINPPRTIYVVGVPDADLVKWAQLAKYTGTKVVVCDSDYDMAAKAANIKDTFDNLSIRGSQMDYNNGNVHTSWSHWRDFHEPIANGRGDFSLYHMHEAFDKENLTGHARSSYFKYLEEIGVLAQSVDELRNIQDRKIENRAAELYEEDVQKEIRKIRGSRSELAAAASPGEGTPGSSGSCYIVCAPPLPMPAAAPAAAAAAYVPARAVAAPPGPAFSNEGDIKVLAINACEGVDLSRKGLDIVLTLIYTHRRVSESANVSQELSGCAKTVYDRIVELISVRSNPHIVTDDLADLVNDFAREAKSSEWSPSAQPSGPNRAPQAQRHCAAEKSGVCVYWTD